MDTRKIKQLTIGESYKYNELCKILDEPIKKGTNSKNAQLKEWSRYFEFMCINKRFIIADVYKEPKDKPYYYPANSIYAECIEKILMTYLSKQESNTTYISSQYLYLVLGMINSNYISMQRADQKQRLIDLMRQKYGWKEEVEDRSINFYIKDFYDRSRSKFSNIINTSLKSLQKRRLIEFSTAYQLYFEKYSEEGDLIEERYYTNDADTRNIMKIERSILDLFGYVNENEVYLHNRTKEYYELILEKAQEEYPELAGVYKCIKLIYNRDDVKNILTKEENRLKKLELNDKIYKFINEQTEKNYLSTENVRFGSGEFKYTRNYEKAQDYLSDKLIKIK